jgi:hypothetical protein
MMSIEIGSEKGVQLSVRQIDRCWPLIAGEHRYGNLGEVWHDLF